jgi:hypothetical protein
VGGWTGVKKLAAITSRHPLPSSFHFEGDDILTGRQSISVDGRPAGYLGESHSPSYENQELT